MNPDFSPELQAELLDDFYAESDEHLSNIRAQLALLESALGQSACDPVVLESIFRSMHSFKGISAMVGLHAAEQLAHAAEDFLRLLSRNTISLTTAVLDLLATTSQRLERMVTAHRLRQPIPTGNELVEHLRAFQAEKPRAAAGSPDPVASAGSPELARRLESLPTRGLAPWRCTFVPSRELDQRGVNVNAVRARLGALGEIVSAMPSVKPGGSIAFEFIVGLRETPVDLARWEADGLVFQPLETAAADPGNPATPPGAATSDESLSPSFFIAPSHIVRVDLSRLDELMRITGEMVIHRSRLEERLNNFGRDPGAVREVNLALGRSLRDLRAALTRVRLVPVAEIFTRMPFVVRDLARESGKRVRLALEGQQTEVDKYLVERLKEPLLHLVRNAFSHGIETPEERIAAGKPAEATILLRAEAAGESVIIQVRDDGRGIDKEVVAERAAAMGLTVPAELDSLGLLNVLCTPGFSTREEADRASGRGVGMAVVRNTMRELGGILSLDTTPGTGTAFTLRLPLTLSIAEMLIVNVGADTCAVPQSSIAEIIQVSERDIRPVKNAEVVAYRDGVLPVVRLRKMFGGAAPSRAQLPVLVVQSERGRAGLLVDRVQAQREVVVRPLRDPLIQVSGISGATELGDGRPVLILDAVTLTHAVVRPVDLSRDGGVEKSPVPLSS